MFRLVILSSLLLSVSLTAQAFSDSKEHFKHHVVGGFLGITDTDETSETSYGVEYEYRFDQHWGLGAVYEITPELHEAHHAPEHGELHHISSGNANEKADVTVYLISGYYHIGALRLGLGFGQEEVDGVSGEKDLFRISAAYDFHVTDNVGIAPTLSIDTINDDQVYVYVYGVTLNWMF